MAKLPSYVTTPIYYANASPHIGHAYSGILADVMARWSRINGGSVLLATGTDEHGQKIAKAASDVDVAPGAYCDTISERFRALGPRLGITADVFIRTTEKRHKRAVRALWKTLVANKQIYLGTYCGWYAVRDESFYTEGDTTVGIDGIRRATVSGAEVEWVEEPSYFFRLSAFRTALLSHYQNNPNFITPTVRQNEIVAMLEQGLTDLSISRANVSWGIPVPHKPAHTVYVWLDALTNYLTVQGYPDSPQSPEIWGATTHVIGKDILKFHAIYWPAFLLAARLPLPSAIVAHGWWTNEGKKISKSVGNVVDPLALVDEVGLDALRYYLLRESPLDRDGDFKKANLIQRADSELANELGNLVHRVLSLLRKHGRLASPLTEDEQDDCELCSQVETLPTRVGIDLGHHFDPQGALEQIWNDIRHANAWVNAQAPWGITDAVQRGKVLRALYDALRIISTVLQPFIPDGAGRILDQLGIPPELRFVPSLKQAIPAGIVLPEPTPAFRKIIQRAEMLAAD